MSSMTCLLVWITDISRKRSALSGCYMVTLFHPSWTLEKIPARKSENDQYLNYEVSSIFIFFLQCQHEGDKWWE